MNDDGYKNHLFTWVIGVVIVALIAFVYVILDKRMMDLHKAEMNSIYELRQEVNQLNER